MMYARIMIKNLTEDMSIRSRRYTLMVVALFAFFAVQAQDSLKVSVRANVKKDIIQLRWVVNSPLAWKQTNRNGFKIERYTVVRDNVILSPAEKIVLTPEPLKPQPLDKWQTLATSNSYAAVVAQALYGEDFQLSGDDAKGISRLIALAQELEQRYLVSMYAADLCYPAALLAGWAYEDKTVKPGERYLYRIIPVVPARSAKIEMGSVYVSLSDYQSLPQPQELTGIFGDKSVMLTWNYKILASLYNSYFIEKSLDGKSFKRISETPYTNMNSKDGKPNDRMYFMDTLVNNTVKTYYRVIGVSSFGEEGPSSEIISGQGKSRLIYVPHIERAIPNQQGGVDVSWEFDERGNIEVKQFQLQRSDTDKGPFVPVVSGIAPGERHATYDSLKSSNYFVIVAIPHNGEPVVSFPVLVQPSDTIPPAIPAGLQGTIDSLGIVRLSWTPNTDKDILGYRIYRAQTKGEELIPLNDVAVRENKFADTVDVHNLNSKAYYAVTALDQRYNQSDKSSIAELRKPELVPPSSPVITNYKLTNQGIWLEWVTGEEENLAELRLYRQERGESENKLVKSITDIAVRNYTDETTESNRYYTYTLLSVTSGGLASAPSPAVTVQAGGGKSSGKFNDFIAKRNRKNKNIVLTWKHDLKDVKELALYKGENGKSVSLWKVMKGFEGQVEDSDVEADIQYEYIIRAVLANGKTGAVATVKIKN